MEWRRIQSIVYRKTTKVIRRSSNSSNSKTSHRNPRIGTKWWAKQQVPWCETEFRGRSRIRWRTRTTNSPIWISIIIDLISKRTPTRASVSSSPPHYPARSNSATTPSNLMRGSPPWLQTRTLMDATHTSFPIQIFRMTKTRRTSTWLRAVRGTILCSWVVSCCQSILTDSCPTNSNPSETYLTLKIMLHQWIINECRSVRLDRAVLSIGTWYPPLTKYNWINLRITCCSKLETIPSKILVSYLTTISINNNKWQQCYSSNNSSKQIELAHSAQTWCSTGISHLKFTTWIRSIYLRVR